MAFHAIRKLLEDTGGHHAEYRTTTKRHAGSACQAAHYQVRSAAGAQGQPASCRIPQKFRQHL